MKKLTLALVCLLAVSSQAETIIVDANGSTGYDNIQAAINVADHNDVIIVNPGIYTGPGNRDIDFLGLAITIRSTDPNDPNIVTATIINCQGSSSNRHRGFKFHNGEGPDSVLAGLTISNGYGPQEEFYSVGGAIFCDGSSPTITNCTFSSNSADHGGGGVLSYRGNPTVTNCTFSGNSAWSVGGGMRNTSNSSPTVTNCTFSGNSANAGGGMWNYSSSPTLSNCILWGNTASSGGNEIYNYDTSSIPVISYCDIAVCGSSGAGWDDDLGDDGGGNIDADPLFVDADNDDYHLLPTSPCIDAGDNTAVPPDSADLNGDGDTTEPIPLDLGGNARFVDQPEVPDTGNGTAPIVDMGAFETNYVESAMKFTPQALNPGSKGKWVKAHFVLPEGFGLDDVDVNSPAEIWPLGIASDYIDVFVNDGLVEIEAAFDRSAFCSNGPFDGTVTVVGLLTSGQSFVGSDTIRIITNNLKYLAVLSSHWLEANCAAPDWCSGVDLDQNSVVDFIDFALFDSCCIEVVKE